MNITVLGAGLMGHGIAQVFAVAGHSVTVYDPVAASLATLQDRIRANLRDLGEDEAPAAAVPGCGVLDDGVASADDTVEAALKTLQVKQDLFVRVAAACRPDTILASNTSAILITDIMRGLRHRGRALRTNAPAKTLIATGGDGWPASQASSVQVGISITKI